MTSVPSTGSLNHEAGSSSPTTSRPTVTSALSSDTPTLEAVSTSHSTVTPMNLSESITFAGGSASQTILMPSSMSLVSVNTSPLHHPLNLLSLTPCCRQRFYRPILVERWAQLEIVSSMFQPLGKKYRGSRGSSRTKRSTPIVTSAVPSTAPSRMINRRTTASSVSGAANLSSGPTSKLVSSSSSITVTVPAAATAASYGGNSSVRRG